MLARRWPGVARDGLQQALALAFVCLLLHLQCRKRAYLVNTVDTFGFSCRNETPDDNLTLGFGLFPPQLRLSRRSHID
jgi:hypothetical protein